PRPYGTGLYCCSNAMRDGTACGCAFGVEHAFADELVASVFAKRVHTRVGVQYEKRRRVLLHGPLEFLKRTIPATQRFEQLRHEVGIHVVRFATLFELPVNLLGPFLEAVMRHTSGLERTEP